MRFIVILLLTISGSCLSQQNNITVSNPLADAVLKGQFNPNLYLSSSPISQPGDIFEGIHDNINPDSLKSYLIQLASFQTRNSGSDTLSASIGIGAARNWILSQFNQYSALNENRLVTSFLEFDQNICGITHHKNVLAMLPGTDTSNHQVIIIEGHMDSRCDGLCDVNCTAEGVEDNASGTALVMELARVMSRYTFPHTLVFMLTTAEEQGLFGANALATYCVNQNIPVKAVLNNDVIGGIACGATSSAPSCPGLDHIDSTQVRLFSHGNFNSKSKQLARFIKLEYKEELLPMVSVPMQVTIMTAEDRTGRGGDHIPFRQKGFASMRFTSANEHGDASNGPGYDDRQHTSEDILGVDTNNDQIIDSFFVDFNYLARNAQINGVAASVAALGPKTPTFEVVGVSGPGLALQIQGNGLNNAFRVGVRTTSNDWDSVYTINSASATLFPPNAANYFVSVAQVDGNGLESLFSDEKLITTATIGQDEIKEAYQGIALLQNRPNPFDESTFISVRAGSDFKNQKAVIQIYDQAGKRIERMELSLQEGLNEVMYQHGYGKVGTFIYTLEVNGRLIDSKKMVFAN